MTQYLKSSAEISGRARQLVTRWRTGEGLYETGIEALDKHVRIAESEMTVIAGSSGMGKTALGMQIAENVAWQFRDGGVMAVFSAEMTGEMLWLRMACANSGVTLGGLRKGVWTDADEAKVYDELDRLRTLPFRVDDRPAPSVEGMNKEIADARAAGINIKGLLFDYLELGGDANAKSEEQRVSGIAKNIRDLGKEFKIPTMLLSQINREPSRRADRMPQNEDMRYSSATEHAADQILLLMRPKYYAETDASFDVDGELYRNKYHEDVAFIRVTKSKNDQRGRAVCLFDGPRMRFVDSERIELNG